jgi:hypothetical protein
MRLKQQLLAILPHAPPGEIVVHRCTAAVNSVPFLVVKGDLLGEIIAAPEAFSEGMRAPVDGRIAICLL